MADRDFRTCCVYGLLSSGGGGIRYVGQTTVGVKRRVRDHVSKALRYPSSNNHRDNWIRKTIADGHSVIWVILEPKASWNTSEREWIARLLNQGVRLTNATNGGEGMLDAPVELRQRIAKRIKELWQDPSYAQRMRDSHKGNEWSDDRRMACEKTPPPLLSERASRGRLKIDPEKRASISRDAAKAQWAEKRAKGTDRGVHCNSAKLNDDSVRIARRLVASGATYAEVGRRFNVSWSTIKKLVLRETWTHVE